VATNMYLKLDGIKGGSSAEGHKEEIEVLSWNHGFSQPTSATRSTAGAGTVEQANHQNFSFSKYFDESTDDLVKTCWNGKQIKNGILTCYRSDGNDENKPVEYLRIELQHIIVSNFSVSGGPGDIPVENVSFDYGIVKYVMIGQKEADGTADAKVEIQHDLETRKVT